MVILSEQMLLGGRQRPSSLIEPKTTSRIPGSSAYAALMRYVSPNRKQRLQTCPKSSERSNFCRRRASSAVGPQRPEDEGKLTVVLDLDECLVHSRLNSEQSAYRQSEERKENVNSLDEFVFPIGDDDVVYCNKRPGLHWFLNEVSKEYEVMAYTAGLECYAGPLLDRLDPTGTIFRHRLYRDSCLLVDGIYVKDLTHFNRPMNRIVLVDNNAMCFLPQLPNGVPISSFYDDADDKALFVLSQFLARIKNEADVRPYLRKCFHLEDVLRFHRDKIIGETRDV